MNAQGAQGVCCRPLPSRPDQGLRRAAVGAVFSGRSRACGILLSRLLPQTAYAQVPLWWVYYHVRLHCPRGGRPSALPLPAGRQPRIRGNRKDIEPRATHTRSRERRGYWGRRRQYWENTGLFYSRGDRGDPGRPLICKLPHPAAHTHSQTLHKKKRDASRLARNCARPTEYLPPDCCWGDSARDRLHPHSLSYRDAGRQQWWRC